MLESDEKLYDELKAKLPIDPYTLEDECRNQSTLLAEVGEDAAEIKREYKQAKEHVEFVRADLLLKIRKNLQDYGLTTMDGKITNDTINATIILQPEYRKAVMDAFDLEETHNSFDKLLAAVESRKSLIRDLVQLYCREYYDSRKLLNEERTLHKVTEESIQQDRNRRAEEDLKEED
jgi:hypothetical protein